MSLIDFFPNGMEPRQAQIDAIENIEKHLHNKKFIVLRAPTGSGKSAIAATLSFYFRSRDEDSYLLCSRKYLQEQYMEDFSSLYTNFWGKSNYTCPLISRSCSACPAEAETSPSRFLSYLRRNCTTSKIGDKCPYIAAKDRARSHDSSLLNFEAFTAHNLYSTPWDRRGALIIDEAHGLSDRLCEQFSITIPGEVQVIGQPIRWIELNQGILKNLKEYYLKSYKEKEESGERFADDKRCYDLMEEMPDKEDWVYNGSTKTITPYKSKGLAHKYLFDYADTVVLMSATITPTMCTELGIKGEDAVFIDVPSEFPPENHPIVFKCMGKLNKRKADTSHQKSGLKDGQNYRIRFNKCVKDIILATEGRGIVHTHSYYYTDWLGLRTSGPATQKLSKIINHTSAKITEKCLKDYMETEESWIITPTLGEGFDGAEDLLRNQIILKAPWPSLGDPRMSRLIKSDFGKKLYATRALSTLMQCYGRGARSPTDTCTTYIIDSDVIRLVTDNWDECPGWFQVVWSKARNG